MVGKNLRYEAASSYREETVNDQKDDKMSMTDLKTDIDGKNPLMTVSKEIEPVNDGNKLSVTANNSQEEEPINDGDIAEQSMTFPESVNDSDKPEPSMPLAQIVDNIIPIYEKSNTETNKSITDISDPAGTWVNNEAGSGLSDKEESVNGSSITQQSMTFPESVNDSDKLEPSMPSAKTEKYINPIPEQFELEQSITDTYLSNPVNENRQEEKSITVNEWTENPGNSEYEKSDTVPSEQTDAIKKLSITDVIAGDDSANDRNESETSNTDSKILKTVNKNTEKQSMPELLVTANDTYHRSEKEKNPVYIQVSCELIERIGQRLNRRIEAGMDFRLYFSHPQVMGWSSRQQSDILWVNERLRCLIDSLLKVSHKRQVTSETIILISKGFSMLIGSKAYLHLPKDYPYHDYIMKKAEQLKKIAAIVRKYRNVKCSLSTARKAVILCILH